MAHKRCKCGKSKTLLVTNRIYRLICFCCDRREVVAELKKEDDAASRRRTWERHVAIYRAGV